MNLLILNIIHELIEEYIKNMGKTIKPIKKSEPLDIQVKYSYCGAPIFNFI